MHKKIYAIVVSVCLSVIVGIPQVSAQCDAVVNVTVFESCLESGQNVTLAGTLNLSGRTITIPSGASISIDLSVFDLVWSGSPWEFANPGVTTELSFIGATGGVDVVKNSPGSGQITVAQLNAAGQATIAIALPVELRSFTAKALPNDQKGIQLDFSTYSESNSAWFGIEHSTDGLTFDEIGQLSAAGNSRSLLTYTFTHFSAVPGNNFYRLKQVDTDGKHAYSPIAQARLLEGPVATVAPNPVHAGTDAVLILGAPSNDACSIFVYDQLGRKILEKYTESSTEQLSIPTTGWVAGCYAVQVVTNGQPTAMLRLQVIQ